MIVNLLGLSLANDRGPGGGVFISVPRLVFCAFRKKTRTLKRTVTSVRQRKEKLRKSFVECKQNIGLQGPLLQEFDGELEHVQSQEKRRKF